MDERMRELGEFLPTLQDPAFVFGEWRGWDRGEDGVTTMPYFELSSEARAVVRALPVVVFDWPTWMGTDEGARFRDPDAVATATAEQLVKLTTAIVRGNRFTEGNLAAAYESGLLTAIVRRARYLGAGIRRLQDDADEADC